MKQTGIFILIISFFSTTSAQMLNNRYVNAKAGQGINFGGKGIVIEYRYKHFGIGAGMGYMSKQYIYDHNVTSSFNYGMNGRYYYYKKSGNWQVYTGISAGWLNNYYFPEIGEKKYNSIVYGIAAILGVEIREELLNVEVGLSIDPGKITFKPETHPYYNNLWYIKPNVGIGINLYALHSKFKLIKSFKNKSYKVNEVSINNDTIKLKAKENVHKALLEQKAANLIENCNNQAQITNEKAYFSKDTLYLLKQVGLKQFIYIKFSVLNTEKEQFHSFSIDSNKSNPLIYFINQSIHIQNIEELANILDDWENYSIAQLGLFSIYINQKACNAKIEQVVFKNQNETISYNSISFCKLNF